MDPVNLTAAFGRFDDHWHPRIVGQVNDTHLKVAKLKGEFIWHHHEHEDECFWVIAGELTMRFRDREVVIRPGEFLVVPRGTEHCPVAHEECLVVLIEPVGTVNTGEEAAGEYTRTDLEQL